MTSGRQMVDNQESLALVCYICRGLEASVRIVHAKRELTICTWSHTHTHTYTHTPTHTYTHTHTRTPTHPHTPTHTHTCTHTCTHTHTHTHRWYHPGISRHIAERMLMSREISDGTYLLRDSLTNTDSLTLSVR